ncbi:MAG: hypothetical protein L6427_12635 [Actinomycetia bacterium]|nr:hypothetical protein [Actinomycetes bacterium]
MIDKQQQRGVKILVRSFIVLVAAGVVVALAYLSVAPFGAEIVLEFGPKGEPGKVTMVSPFTFSSIAGTDEEGAICQVPQMKMTADEVTFEVKVPYEEFSRLTAEIKYRGDPNELLIGVKGSPDSGYLYMPINNNSLNMLKWYKIEDKDRTLYQKSDVYETIDGFLDELPQLAEAELAQGRRYSVATYYYQVDQPKPFIDDARANEPTRVNATLRGPHTFYAYVTGDKRPRLSITKQDINIYQGNDELSIHIFKGDEVVYSRTIPDDGDTSASIVPGKPKRVDMMLPDLSEGVYKIVFHCGSDLLISDISFSQNYFCAFGEVFLADHDIYMVGPSKEVTLYTDAEQISAMMRHPEFSQVMEINEEGSVVIPEGSKTVVRELEEDISSVKMEMGDVIVESKDSCFAFSEESFFDPFPLKTLDYRPDVALTNVDYIIAGYTTPEREGESFTRAASIDVSGVIATDGILRFAVLSPGLVEDNGEIIIESLKLTVTMK